MNTNNTTPHELARIRVQSWNEGVKEYLEMRFGNNEIKLEHLTRLANLKARVRFEVIDKDEIRLTRQHERFGNQLTIALS